MPRLPIRAALLAAPAIASAAPAIASAAPAIASAAPAIASAAPAIASAAPAIAAPPSYPPNYPQPLAPGMPLASRLHRALGAPENWFITGSLRLRAEAIDGQFRPIGANSDAMFSLRTAILAEYHTGPLRIGAEMMDSRAYFQKANSTAGTTEVNAMELIQAYAGVDLGDALAANSTATLTAGRFTLDVGSRRLVARSHFRNTTNAFTGLRLDWRANGQGAMVDSATLFWTLPQTRLPRDPAGIRANRVEFDRESLDAHFFGASGTRAQILGGTAQLYALGLLESDAPEFLTTNRRLFTVGARLFRSPRRGHFDHDIEGAYQIGSTRATLLPGDTDDLDVAAFFVHLEAGHTFAAPWSPRLAVHYDHASGDDSDPRTFTRFDPLFGARRWEFGPSGLYGPITRTNLIAPGLRGEINPNSRLDAFIAWRPLWLASATDAFAVTGVRDRSGAAGRFAGHQVEARLRYWLVPATVRLDTGAALLAKSAFFRDAPLGRDNGDTRYGYFDVNVLF